MTETAAVPRLKLLREPASRTDLQDWGRARGSASPEMTTSGVTLWSDGSGAEAGVWECMAGSRHFTYETNELVTVLAGSMTVTPDGDEPIEIEAGDVVLFPAGWSGSWEIHETLRKVYVVF